MLVNIKLKGRREGDRRGEREKKLNSFLSLWIFQREFFFSPWNLNLIHSDRKTEHGWFILIAVSFADCWFPRPRLLKLSWMLPQNFLWLCEMPCPSNKSLFVLMLSPKPYVVVIKDSYIFISQEITVVIYSSFVHLFIYLLSNHCVNFSNYISQNNRHVCVLWS